MPSDPRASGQIGCDVEGHPQHYAHDCDEWERETDSFLEAVGAVPETNGSGHLDTITEERDRYKAALERIQAKRRSEEEFWHQDRHFPTEASKNWHDGHITAMATISLICSEALDPVEWAEHQEQWSLASHGTDREWFERTGMCGHCGNPGDECLCTPADPCGCGPHDLRTDPIPCIRCKGAGVILPVGARRQEGESVV